MIGTDKQFNSVVIIGAGTIGMLVGHDLQSKFSVFSISARALLDGTAVARLEMAMQLEPAIIFAHGAPVNIRTFERDYDLLLHTRIEPLELVQKAVLQYQLPARTILISSTVAALEATNGLKNLACLQLAYEQRFVELFGSASASILRVGSVIDQGSQINEGIKKLKKTLLLKRLRIAGGSKIAWADNSLICNAVNAALDGSRHELMTIVAHPEGVDLNTLLDQLIPVRFAIQVPAYIYRWIWCRLGVREEFFYPASLQL
jgi:hypothetical protein